MGWLCSNCETYNFNHRCVVCDWSKPRDIATGKKSKGTDSASKRRTRRLVEEPTSSTPHKNKSLDLFDIVIYFVLGPVSIVVAIYYAIVGKVKKRNQTIAIVIIWYIIVTKGYIIIGFMENLLR